MSNSAAKYVPICFMVGIISFTLGYGGRHWLGSNDIAKGLEAHVSQLESENIAKETANKISDYAKIFSFESSFEDAKEDLLEAIEENGLVISYTSHAKTMLDNTAEVSGVTQAVYDNAEILLFCKADLSHKLVAANPHNIVLCPYSIAIYVMNAAPERVYLSYRKVENSDNQIKALTKPIEDLLVKVIKEVIE